MVIQQARIKPYCLPFKKNWKTSSDNLNTRQGWLITLRLKNGLIGYGDAAPLISAGTETPDQAQKWLQIQVEQLKGISLSDATQKLEATRNAPPAARCGLEMAVLDLLAKSHEQPLAQYLNPNAVKQVKVNANLGMAIDLKLSTLQMAIEQGYRIIKLKVGLASPAEELTCIKNLVQQLPAGIKLRLDANQAWSFEQANFILPQLTGMPIDSVEEPLQQPDFKALAKLQHKVDYAIALDESLAYTDTTTLFSHPVVKRLVLKPMREGGLLPTIALARQAKAAGIDVVITTTIDSAVGCWATAHLAAAISQSHDDLAHGLDTSSWLASDVAEPPEIRQGTLRLNNNSGIGITPVT